MYEYAATSGEEMKSVPEASQRVGGRSTVRNQDFISWLPKSALACLDSCFLFIKEDMSPCYPVIVLPLAIARSPSSFEKFIYLSSERKTGAAGWL